MHRIAEEATFQQIREVEMDSSMLSSVNGRNSRQRSQSVKIRHDTPSMALSRNVLKGVKPRCHRKVRHSNVSQKDIWKMPKEPLAIEVGTQFHEALRNQRRHSSQSNNNSYKLLIERRMLRGIGFYPELSSQKDCSPKRSCQSQKFVTPWLARD